MDSKNIIERLIFSLADGISCVCKTTMQRSCFDKYRNKMLPYVYNRMPVINLSEYEAIAGCREELDISKNAHVGIYVGRMTREKGLDSLFEAFQILDKCWPENFYFIFVGEGDYKDIMENKCSVLENRDRIIFVGQRTDVNRFLLSSNFFVQPSLHENLSISILEACAAQLPCLVTDVGGNREILVDGITGIIVDKGNALMLAKGIKQLNDLSFCEKINENLKKYDFSKFYAESVDKQLDKVYMKLLKEMY